MRDLSVAHVGYTGTDDDRDRWLAARIWLQRNDRRTYNGLSQALASVSLHQDCVDLNSSPRRDFLSERARYDIVLTHNLWGQPELISSDAGGAVCSPLHTAAGWRRRLVDSGARYIFLFGPDFNGSYFDGLISGFMCFDVPALSFLTVFASGRKREWSSTQAQPISYRDMTGARLGALSELLMNRNLDLSYSGVTSAELQFIPSMPNLTDLRLVGTGIRDSDLELVSQNHGIRFLSLDETNISDRALVYLAGLEGLKGLSLNHTKISSDALMHLAELPGLVWLSVAYTGIGEDGLKHLEKMKALESLSLAGTKVTNTQIEKLRSAQSKCFIAF